MQSPAPFGTLAARAFHVCARRWAFYLAIATVVFGLQAALFWIPHLRWPDIIGGLIVLPLLSVTVYVFAGCDLTAEDVPPGARWTRILERSWAVILIQIVVGALTALSIAAGSTDPAGVLLGLLAYALVAVTIYADVNAALEPDLSVWRLIPRSFARSAQLALHRFNVFLTLSLVATFVLLSLGTAVASQWLAEAHVPAAQYWGIAIETLLTVPYSALAVTVYFECSAREKAALRNGRD